MKRFILFALPLFLLAVFSYSTTAGAESSCVTCHTSEGIMKSLCKPPQIPVGEGEG